MRSLLLPLDRLLFAAAVALFLPGVVTLVPAQAQDLSDGSGYTVAGTVLNEATGQPVARAEVTLDNDQAQLTTGDGAFSFDHVSAGSATLSIRKPGYMRLGTPGRNYVRSFGGSVDFGPPLQMLVGPEMPSLTVRLIPLASISGHLTLSTADPADHIRVTLFRRAFQDGRSRWSIAGVTTTRSDGSWRVANLVSGRYMVLTSASIDGPNDPEDSAVPVQGFPALYYPGVTDAGSAGVLILKPGQHTQADMTLVRQRFFPVTIAVRGMPDTPTGFQIDDTGGRPTGLPVHFDLRNGIAHANVPNGSWTLVAHAFGVTMRAGSTDFQVASTPVSLEVTVLPVPRIPAIIHRDFVATANGAQPPPSGPGMNLVLVSAEDFSSSPYAGGLRSDNNHDWEVSVAGPGRYWVEVQPFPPAYVSSVTSGGTDLATTPLTITPGSPPPPIEITLRNDSGTISGTIDSQSPGGGGAGQQPQVRVYAIPLFPTTGRVPEKSLRDNGKFTLEDLAPGSYRVVACDARQEIDDHSPEGLAAWSGKGQVVTVNASGTASVELRVVHGDASQ